MMVELQRDHNKTTIPTVPQHSNHHQYTIQTHCYNQLTSEYMGTAIFLANKIYPCKFCSDTLPHFNASWSVNNYKITDVNNMPKTVPLKPFVPVEGTRFNDSAQMTETNFIKPRVPYIPILHSTVIYYFTTLMHTTPSLFKCATIERNKE